MVDGDIVVAMGSGGWEAVCRGGCPESDAGEESCVGLSVFPPDGSGGVAYHQRESALSMCEWMQNPEERHLERGVGIHIQSWRVALKKGKKKGGEELQASYPPESKYVSSGGPVFVSRGDARGHAPRKGKWALRSGRRGWGACSLPSGGRARAQPSRASVYPLPSRFPLEVIKEK